MLLRICAKELEDRMMQPFSEINQGQETLGQDEHNQAQHGDYLLIF